MTDPVVARIEANPKYHELRRKRGSFGIGNRLRRIAGAGNDHAHRVEHQDPAQREFRHCRVARNQRPDLLDRRQPTA